MSTISINYCKTLRFIFSKTHDHNNQGRKFSHISNLIITFTTNRFNMTDELFLKQNKQMVEWVIMKKSKHFILNGNDVDYGEDIEDD